MTEQRPGIYVAVYTDVRKSDSQMTRNALAAVLEGIAHELREGNTPSQGSEVIVRAKGEVVTENNWDLYMGLESKDLTV